MAARLLHAAAWALLGSVALAILVVDQRDSGILPPEAYQHAGFNDWSDASCDEDCYLPDIVDLESVRWPEDGERLQADLSTCLHAASVDACRPSPALTSTPPPFEELYSHFLSLLSATAPLRGVQWSRPAGSGDDATPGRPAFPGLENIFLRRFGFTRTFNHWYPAVPILVQFSDADAWSVSSSGAEQRLSPVAMFFERLRPLLRNDTLYVVVTAKPKGLLGIHPDCSLWRNMLSLSAGGWGSVPLPLLHREAPQLPPRGSAAVAHIISVAGTPSTPPALAATVASRVGAGVLLSRAAGLAAATSRALSVGDATGADEEEGTAAAALTLALPSDCPASYAFYRTLQRGRAAAMVWTTTQWQPYQGRADPLWDVRGVALSVQAGDVGSLARVACDLLRLPAEAVVAGVEGGQSDALDATPQVSCLDATGTGVLASPPSAVAEMERKLAAVRDRYFTWTALMRHVEQFIYRPWTSELECAGVTDPAKLVFPDGVPDAAAMTGLQRMLASVASAAAAAGPLRWREARPEF